MGLWALHIVSGRLKKRICCMYNAKYKRGWFLHYFLKAYGLPICFVFFVDKGEKALFAEALQYGPHHFLLRTVCTEKRFRIVFFLAFPLSQPRDVFKTFGINRNYNLSFSGVSLIERDCVTEWIFFLKVLKIKSVLSVFALLVQKNFAALLGRK